MSTDLPESSWSIDELSALVGMPTRTVREYRTIGVIDPPRMEGRVGRYGESHRRRLELVARLQERGYSLAAIRDLCAASASGRSLDDVLGGDVSMGIDEGAVAYSLADLISVVPALRDERIRDLAVRGGLVRDVDDQWLVRAPSLLALVADAIAAGVSPRGALRMAERLSRGARLQAAAFADMVVDELWHDDDDLALRQLVKVGRRARMQLTRAVASLIVHEVGLELRERAASRGDGGLSKLVDELRVGVVRRSTAP